MSVPCIFASFLIASLFRWAPFLLATGVIAYTLWMYNKLVKINPRLVQSEKSQVEMQKLDIISEKGGPIIFDTIDIPLSEDPKALMEVEPPTKQLSAGDEHG